MTHLFKTLTETGFTVWCGLSAVWGAATLSARHYAHETTCAACLAAKKGAGS